MKPDERERFEDYLCERWGEDRVRPICWNGEYPSLPGGFAESEVKLVWQTWQAALAAAPAPATEDDAAVVAEAIERATFITEALALKAARAALAVLRGQ